MRAMTLFQEFSWGEGNENFKSTNNARVWCGVTACRHISHK